MHFICQMHCLSYNLAICLPISSSDCILLWNIYIYIFILYFLPRISLYPLIHRIFWYLGSLCCFRRKGVYCKFHKSVSISVNASICLTNFCLKLTILIPINTCHRFYFYRKHQRNIPQREQSSREGRLMFNIIQLARVY